MEALAYVLLKGRLGVWGHARTAEGRREVWARGLPPGEKCTLYCLGKGCAFPCDTAPADGEGQVRLSLTGGGQVFLTAGNRVVLWEEGEQGGESYFRACQALDRLQERPLPEQAVGAVQAGESSLSPGPAAPASGADDSKQSEERPVKEAQAKEIGDLKPFVPPPPAAPEGPSYPLRTPGSGEGVDALPALSWPGEAAGLRPYFDSLPPAAPFDAPGWRFVRAPSPLREAIYCYVGYWAQDGRVARVAYALPGTPYRPPEGASGYRYQMGRRGQGYWTLWRRV